MWPYIKERGDSVVQSQEYLKDPLLFTQKLLELHLEIAEMLQHSFQNNILFQKSRDRAFLVFLNEQSLSATYIAAYIDNEMKKGFKGVPDVEVEKRLKAIIELFQCLHARDIFMKAYERDYA